MLAAQDDIARAVVSALRPRLLPAEAPTTSAHGSRNVEAYAEYLLARRFMNEGQDESYRGAIRALERALEHDPGYAAAWALLGEALVMHSASAASAREAAALRRRGLVSVDKAIAIGPDQPDGFVRRAFMRSALLWDFAGARSDLARALKLSPGNATALRERAFLSFYFGQFRRGHPGLQAGGFARPARSLNLARSRRGSAWQAAAAGRPPVAAARATPLAASADLFDHPRGGRSARRPP